MIRTLEEMTVMAEGLVAYAKGAGDAEQTQTVDLGALLARLCEERGRPSHPPPVCMYAPVPSRWDARSATSSTMRSVMVARRGCAWSGRTTRR